MSKLLSTFGLIAVLLVFALGSDFDVILADDDSGVASLGGLRSELQKELAEQRTTIDIDYAGDKKELSDHIAALLRDALAADDYIAYIVDSYLYTVRTWGTYARIEVTVQYRESAEQNRQVENRVDALLPTIVNAAMSGREKVKAIHDWIVTHVAYDQSLQKYTAYEALETGEAVCQGYSLLMYRMLNAAGIETRIIEGNVPSGSHVWNLVRLGSAWYHVDATWDDPLPDRPGQVSHAYFLKSDSQMRRDHQWTKAYPAALSND